MSRLTRTAIILAALAVSLTGCADNRMNGGYTGDTANMARLTAQQAAAQQSPPAQTGTSNYVYRGGRDPVTGKANLSY